MEIDVEGEGISDETLRFLAILLVQFGIAAAGQFGKRVGIVVAGVYVAKVAHQGVGERPSP